MLLDHQNTSFEVEAAQPEIALLPIGATEACGDHLPIGTTTLILDTLARRVADGLKATTYLLPTMPLGTSGLHRGAHGTISLEWRTLMLVITDLVESLLTQGIRKIVVLNGLGGANESTALPRENRIVKTSVRQLNYGHPELDAIWVQPFTVAGPKLREIIESTDEDIHAGELATSLMLHLAPEDVGDTAEDFVPSVSKEFLDYVAFGSVSPKGIWGKPSLATADKGARALETAVRSTIAYIEDTFSRLAKMKNRMPDEGEKREQGSSE